MSSFTQYYRRYLVRATIGPPSEAVTVNPTNTFRSFKKTFGLSIVTILPHLDALEAKGSMRSTLKLCFRYLLVLRSPVGMINENVTIVYMSSRWTSTHLEQPAEMFASGFDASCKIFAVPQMH